MVNQSTTAIYCDGEHSDHREPKRSTIKIDGQWYVDTKEGVLLGPYSSESTAAHAADFLNEIRDCRG